MKSWPYQNQKVFVDFSGTRILSIKRKKRFLNSKIRAKLSDVVWGWGFSLVTDTCLFSHVFAGSEGHKLFVIVCLQSLTAICLPKHTWNTHAFVSFISCFYGPATLLRPVQMTWQLVT